MTERNKAVIRMVIAQLSDILDDELNALEATQIIQAVSSLKYALSKRKKGV